MKSLDYGVKIRNIEAATLYEFNIGIRDKYSYIDAVLVNSLFKDFLDKIGMRVKNGYTRDVICLDFNFGTVSYKEQLKRLDKAYKKADGNEEKQKNIKKLIEQANNNHDLFKPMKVGELREEIYVNGINVHYETRGKLGALIETEDIHYKMLYRTAGKAKVGKCMFINDIFYDKAIDFLRMGIELPFENAPIVEIGAYSSLVTSSIINKIHINPKDILIIKDVDSFLETEVINIITDENKHCKAVRESNCRLKNTLFDGQALIDTSVFPYWGNGYILLRHHFCKMAAFHSNIQLFFKDYYEDDYDTAKVKDMFGNYHYVKDIKVITTENAMKWMKFDISYEYWCKRVEENGSMFGVVKTAHKSKLGQYQRMSYQMVNSLDESTMEGVVKCTKNYVERLKKDDNMFLNYLRENVNFSNDYSVLIALCERYPEFVKCKYFRERKRTILYNYILNFKTGKVIQNADNLVIVGSPYAMLLHTVGEDVEDDPTLDFEVGCTQCFTERFNDDEYLAEFRSPFNSRNNLGYLHNVYSAEMFRYFNFGEQIIAVNMIHTDFQDKNNGSDMDSDSIYVTNQKDIVNHAKYCCENYPTIVNRIPKSSNSYNNTLSDFARVDTNIAKANMAIGQSSNMAQLCLSYTYNFDDVKYDNYVCILSVLAQCAIDNAKRTFDIDLNGEISRIKKDMNIDMNGYPIFWKTVQDKDKNKKTNRRKDKDGNKVGFDVDGKLVNKNLKCPMNYLDEVDFSVHKMRGKALDLDYFFIKHPLTVSKRRCKNVENLIVKYSFNLYKNSIDDNDDFHILYSIEFNNLIEDIKKTYISSNYLGLMSWLIDRALCITTGAKRNKSQQKIARRNVPLLLKVLYDTNPEAFLSCFAKSVI